MITKKNCFILLFFVLLLSIGVVSATDNNASNVTSTTSSDMKVTNTSYENNNDNNALSYQNNDKNNSIKNISKKSGNDKLSLNYTLDNKTGVITFTEYRTQVRSTTDWASLYMEGVLLDSDMIEYVEEPFQVTVNNIMSDGRVDFQYQVFSWGYTEYWGGKDVWEEKVCTFNYTSRTPITLKNDIKVLDSNSYIFTSTAINRATKEKVTNNATLEYYAVEYPGSVVPTLVSLGNVSVVNGVGKISFNTSFTPIVIKYSSNNFTGYYISREVNRTSVTLHSSRTLSHSEKIKLNATVTCDNSYLTVNSGNLTFKLYTEGKNDTLILGTSPVKRGYAEITCVIPDTYRNSSGRLALELQYSGSNEHNFEKSGVICYVNIENKYPPVIKASPVSGKLGRSVVFSVNFTAFNKTLNAPVAVKVNGLTVARGKTVNGSFSTSYVLNTRMFADGRYNLSYVCGETWTTSRKVFNTTLDVEAYDTSIRFNKTTARVGDIVTLNVSLTNGSGNYKVQSGKFGFKIDGVTYKNAEGPLIVQIANGTAHITFIVNKAMIGTHNITFTYSGNYQFKTARATFNNSFMVVNGTEKQYNARVLFNKTTVSAGKKVILNVSVCDSTGRYYSTNGLMGFKINGITYKDEVGNPVIARIHNGTARFVFTAPNNLPALNNVTFTFSGTQVLKSTKVTLTNALNIKA